MSSMDGINSVDMLSGKIIVCEDLHLLLLLNKITSVLVKKFTSGLDEFVGSKTLRFGSLIKYLLKFEPLQNDFCGCRNVECMSETKTRYCR